MGVTFLFPNQEEPYLVLLCAVCVSLAIFAVKILTAKATNNSRRLPKGTSLCDFFVHVPLNRVLHEFARAAQRQFFFDVRLV
jgi:hypothetical protein